MIERLSGFAWRRWAQMAGAVVRVWLGWRWFEAGFEKVGNPVWTGSQAGAAVGGFLKGALAKAAGEHPDVQPFYAQFIERVALPNAHVFSYLVAYGELLTGIALMLGAFTGVALVAGALMNLNYLLAGTVSVNPIWLTAAFVLLWIGGTGYLGADGLWSYIRTRWSPLGGGIGRDEAFDAVRTDSGRPAA